MNNYYAETSTLTPAERLEDIELTLNAHMKHFDNLVREAGLMWDSYLDGGIFIMKKNCPWQLRGDDLAKEKNGFEIIYRIGFIDGWIAGLHRAGYSVHRRNEEYKVTYHG